MLHRINNNFFFLFEEKGVSISVAENAQDIMLDLFFFIEFFMHTVHTLSACMSKFEGQFQKFLRSV